MLPGIENGDPEAFSRVLRTDRTASALWIAAHGLQPDRSPRGRPPVVPGAVALRIAQELVNKSYLVRHGTDTTEDAVTRLLRPVVGVPAARGMAHRLCLLVEHADILCDPALSATAVSDVLHHRDVWPPSPPQAWTPQQAATLRRNIVKDAERLDAPQECDPVADKLATVAA